MKRTLATATSAGGHPGPYELALDPRRSALAPAAIVVERAGSTLCSSLTCSSRRAGNALNN
jgi:hypothetical protein